MITQDDIAKHLCLSDGRQIRNLQNLPGAPVKRGRGDHDLDAWREFYINFLRSKSGAHDVLIELEADADEAEMKALALDKLRLVNDDKRETIKGRKLSRKIKEGAYAPIEIIPIAVMETARALQSRVEGWLPRLKQAWPDMPIEAYQALQKEQVALLNELSDTDIDLSAFVDVDTEGD